MLVGIPNVGKSALANSLHQVGRISAAGAYFRVTLARITIQLCFVVSFLKMVLYLFIPFIYHSPELMRLLLI